MESWQDEERLALDPPAGARFYAASAVVTAGVFLSERSENLVSSLTIALLFAAFAIPIWRGSRAGWWLVAASTLISLVIGVVKVIGGEAETGLVGPVLATFFSSYFSTPGVGARSDPRK